MLQWHPWNLLSPQLHTGPQHNYYRRRWEIPEMPFSTWTDDIIKPVGTLGEHMELDSRNKQFTKQCLNISIITWQTHTPGCLHTDAARRQGYSIFLWQFATRGSNALQSDAFLKIQVLCISIIFLIAFITNLIGPGEFDFHNYSFSWPCQV